MTAVHTCGAPAIKHPPSGYSDSGACLEALKASRVMTTCDWPECGKRVRKLCLGYNMCRAHGDKHRDAYMRMSSIEGPITLSRHHKTIAECAEFSQTGVLPASRNYTPTFEQTRTNCSTCGGPLVILNGDWTPKSGPVRPSNPSKPNNASGQTAWGVGICRNCSLPKRRGK